MASQVSRGESESRYAVGTQTRWAWHDNPNLYEVKIGSGVLPRPKHARLEHDNPSLRGVKMGLRALFGPKHDGLKHDNSSFSWVYIHSFGVYALAET